MYLPRVKDDGSTARMGERAREKVQLMAWKMIEDRPMLLYSYYVGETQVERTIILGLASIVTLLNRLMPRNNNDLAIIGIKS